MYDNQDAVDTGTPATPETVTQNTGDLSTSDPHLNTTTAEEADPSEQQEPAPAAPPEMSAQDKCRHKRR